MIRKATVGRIAGLAMTLAAARLPAASYDGGRDDGWVAGDSPALTLGGAAVTLVSSDCTFTRGDATTPLPALTLTDDGTTPGIKAATGLRVSLPPGLPVRWDTRVATVTLGGTAAGKIAAAVSYQDAAGTLVLEVTGDFAAGDAVTIDGLAYANVVAAGLGSLSLDFDNDGRTDATDPAVHRVLDRGMAGGPADGWSAGHPAGAVSMGGSAVTLASAAAATYTRGDAPAPCPTLTITDDPANPGIKAGTGLRITLPAGLRMTWNTNLTTAVLGGTAAGRASAGIAYEDDGRTLVIGVTADFAPADALTLEGLEFAGFISAGVGRLAVDYSQDGLADATDGNDQRILDRGMTGGPADGAAAAIAVKARRLALDGILFMVH